jgi:hypothetical protein
MYGRSQWPAARSRTWNVFARSNTRIVDSNPTQCMDACLYLFCLLGSGLATGWSPVQGVLPTVLNKETPVKRSVSQMPCAPSGSNRRIRKRGRRRRRRRRRMLWKQKWFLKSSLILACGNVETQVFQFLNPKTNLGIRSLHLSQLLEVNRH